VPEGHLCVQSGSPPAKKPTRKGFGMPAIKQMIRPEGEVHLDWRAEGLAIQTSKR
jgi:hypothetical protein